jgi:hypothetical protein
MPTFKVTQKKLFITDYVKEFLKKDEEAWITIYKMQTSFKKKLDILSWQSLGNDTGKKMYKELKSKGIKLDDLEKMPKEEAAEIMMGMDIDFEEKKKCLEYSNEVQQLIFEKCIDPDNHNWFEDEAHTKKIKANDWNFWDKLGNAELIEFIFDEIEELSKGFFFTKNGETK